MSEQTYEAILKREMARVPGDLDTREGSLIWYANAPGAVELVNLNIAVEEALNNGFADTASREYLIRRAAERGLSPQAASAAVLELTTTPAEIEIPLGTRFSIGALNYAITKRVAAGVYEITCETPGEAGNDYSDTCIPIEYVKGLETCTVTALLIPGEDEEATEIFRQRYFSSLHAQAFGGNRQDYIEKVNAIPGVGAVKVYRAWNSDIAPASLFPPEGTDAWLETLPGIPEEIKNWLDTMYAYSASLTKSMPTALSTVRESHAGASVEGYALFAGGANGTRSTDIVDSVDAYSASLTRTAAATLSGKRKWIGAASLEGRAFFAGGASTNLNSNTKCANVEVYNGTLTRTAATNLSVARYSPLTATIGGRVLFAGGDFTKVVDVYSASLTRTAAADLSRSTSGGDASIAVGNYAIFTSGLVVGSDGVGSFVGNTSCDVYNASLTKTTVTLLSVARVYMSAGTVGDYALFAGGGSNSPYSDVVDACDTSLTRTTVTALDYPRRNLSSATVGDYLLFAGGGRDYDDPSSVVFVYTA